MKQEALEIINSDIQANTDFQALTKKNALNLAKDVSDKVEEGLIDPLKTYVQANYLSNMMEGIKSNLKNKVKDIITSPEYEKEHKMFGIGITIQERKSCTNFNQDPIWNKFQKELKEIKQKIAEREEYLLAIKPTHVKSEFGEDIILYPKTVDPDSGEEVSLFGPAYEITSYPVIRELK
jgi:hypothetical protein